MLRKILVVAIIAVVVIISFIWLLFSHSQGANLVNNSKIAVIYVDGVIMGGRAAHMFNEYSGTDGIMRQLRDAKNDPNVKAVVIRINSPGGSVPATQEVGEEILKVRQAGKLVVASMGDIAASGGYWLAAVTDKIYANPSTLTGSIGVYIPYANWQELYSKIGIKQEKIKSGLHKDILSPDRPITVGEREIIQSMVNDMYEQFVEVVATGRKMEYAKVKQLADGRIYTGKRAKELGLVDEMGNLYDAIDGVAKMVGIDGTPTIKEYKANSPFSFLFGASDKFSMSKNILPYLEQQPFISNIPLAMPERW